VAAVAAEPEADSTRNLAQTNLAAVVDLIEVQDPAVVQAALDSKAAILAAVLVVVDLSGVKQQQDLISQEEVTLTKQLSQQVKSYLRSSVYKAFKQDLEILLNAQLEFNDCSNALAFMH